MTESMVSNIMVTIMMVAKSVAKRRAVDLTVRGESSQAATNRSRAAKPNSIITSRYWL